MLDSMFGTEIFSHCLLSLFRKRCNESERRLRSIGLLPLLSYKSHRHRITWGWAWKMIVFCWIIPLGNDRFSSRSAAKQKKDTKDFLKRIPAPAHRSHLNASTVEIWIKPQMSERRKSLISTSHREQRLCDVSRVETSIMPYPLVHIKLRRKGLDDKTPELPRETCCKNKEVKWNRQIDCEWC